MQNTNWIYALGFTTNPDWPLSLTLKVQYHCHYKTSLVSRNASSYAKFGTNAMQCNVNSL